MNDDNDEIIIEDIEEENSGNQQVAKLRKRLQTCVEEKQEYLDGWQRAKADLVNFKKRSVNMSSEACELTEFKVFSDIITVLDSFDAALAQNQENEGFQNIYKQFDSILEEYNVKSFNPEGEEFNPHQHDPVEMVEGEKDGIIMDVLQKGYKMRDKIIRPAKVRVSKLADNKK